MAVAKHKAAETAYRTHRRVTERDVKYALEGLEEERLQYKVLKTPLKEYEVRYDRSYSGWYNFYVFDGTRAIAIVDIEPVSVREFKKLLVPGVKPVTPHIMLHKDYRKMGLASRIYLSILSGKFVFATDSHTENAKALWDRISQVKGIRSMYAYEYADRPLAPDVTRRSVGRASRLLGQAKYFVDTE